jgi:dolichol-phosphate mannosyltransferase
MDGDLQHDPKYIKKMYANFKKKKLDFVVATRDFKNSNFILYRKFLSKILNFIVNLTLGTKVSDPLSGYFIFKKKIFTQNKKKLYGYGYKILMDLIYSPKKSFKVEQMSIVFSIRTREKSKLNYKIFFHLMKFIYLCKKKNFIFT